MQIFQIFPKWMDVFDQTKDSSKPWFLACVLLCAFIVSVTIMRGQAESIMTLENQINIMNMDRVYFRNVYVRMAARQAESLKTLEDQIKEERSLRNELEETLGKTNDLKLKYEKEENLREANQNGTTLDWSVQWTWLLIDIVTVCLIVYFGVKGKGQADTINDLEQQNNQLTVQYQEERKRCIELKEVVDQTEAKCNDWKDKYEVGINQVRGLEERIETMAQQYNQLIDQLEEEVDQLKRIEAMEHQNNQLTAQHKQERNLPDSFIVTVFDLYAKGHFNQLKTLLHSSIIKNPQDPNDPQRGTLLHKACKFARHGELEFVQFLVPLLSDKNPKDKVGRTPLHLAAINGRTEVVKYLVSVVDDKHPKNKWGDTPLDYARSMPRSRSKTVVFIDTQPQN